MKRILLLLIPVSAMLAAQQPGGQPSLSFGTIQGVVTQKGSATPIAGVKVSASVRTLSGQGMVVPTITQINAETDSSGRFIIRDVPEGTAFLRAQLPGFFGPSFNGNPGLSVANDVRVTAGQIANVSFSLIPGGTLTGRVFDWNGKALQGAPVRALRAAYDDGIPVLQIVANKTTDDRGEYRIYGLPPGKYYVATDQRRVSGPAAVALREQPAPTLYPNAIDVAGAKPITIREGEEVSGLDIRINAAMTARVRGTVVSPFGAQPIINSQGVSRPSTVTLTIVPHDRTALRSLNSAVTVTAKPADGSFEFPNVLPGVYDVFARVAATKGWGAKSAPAGAVNPFAIGRATVEVRGTDVDDVHVVIQPGTDLSGQLVLDGKRTAAHVQVMLVPDDGARSVEEQQIMGIFDQVSTYEPPLQADGSFVMPMLPEGRYRFSIELLPDVAPQRGRPIVGEPLPGSAYVDDIRQAGLSVYASGVQVDSKTQPSVEVVVKTDGGSVNATVTDALARKPAAGVTIALVPADRRRQNPDSYKLGRTDAKGFHNFIGVAPGLYKVFAWEGWPSGAYQNPEFLSGIEGRGAPVNVTGKGTASASVELIRAEP